MNVSTIVNIREEGMNRSTTVLTGRMAREKTFPSAGVCASERAGADVDMCGSLRCVRRTGLSANPHE